MTVVLVVAGGAPPVAALAQHLPAADAVIAADSGLDHARLLGLEPSVLIGDLDSISADGLAWAESHDIQVIRHPVDKDTTDLQLAMDLAARSADEIVVVDGGVGRLDHALGNMLLLASPRYAGVAVSAWLGPSLLTVVCDRRELDGRPGDVVSLFALGGPARGVSTNGLRWRLDHAALEPGATIGISNEMLADGAWISVGEGVVLVVQPDHLRG